MAPLAPHRSFAALYSHPRTTSSTQEHHILPPPAMCTLEKRGRVFLLTLTGDDEHRLNPTLLDNILNALHRVRTAPLHATALVTTAQGKFFSNGFDLTWARSTTPGSSDTFESRSALMFGKLELIIAALSTLPCPTIAAVSGHAAAAGFLLALSHDYIFMRNDRGFIYMSELDIGITFPENAKALIGCKIPVASVRRDVILRSKKFTARSAVEAGLIDKALESSGETVKEALRFGEELAGRGWDGRVYTEIRLTAFPELAAVVGSVTEDRTRASSRL